MKGRVPGLQELAAACLPAAVPARPGAGTPRGSGPPPPHPESSGGPGAKSDPGPPAGRRGPAGLGRARPGLAGDAALERLGGARAWPTWGP